MNTSIPGFCQVLEGIGVISKIKDKGYVFWPNRIDNRLAEFLFEYNHFKQRVLNNRNFEDDVREMFLFQFGKFEESITGVNTYKKKKRKQFPANIEGSDKFYRANEFVDSVNKFSSKQGTLEHIKRVNELLLICSKLLIDRAINHDSTKIVEPELSGFDKLTPDFRKLEYGSEEYYKVINSKEVKQAIEHHHKNNSHHVEYYDNGIYGMNLLDILEMLVDWKAATERNANGVFIEHLNLNFKRFKIPVDIQAIMINTSKILNFI